MGEFPLVFFRNSLIFTFADSVTSIMSFSVSHAFASGVSDGQEIASCVHSHVIQVLTTIGWQIETGVQSIDRSRLELA